MPKSILGVLGSPCEDGNTAALLDAALEGARSAGARSERLDIADLDIEPCDSCRKCDTTGGCILVSDDMSKVYKRLREIDALVIASPIYFMGVSAQLKALIDRCQCFWIEKYVLNHKPYKGRPHPKGLFIATAGSKKHDAFEPAIHCAKAFFAALDYDYAGEILLGDTDSPDIATRRSPVLKRARAAGERLVA